MKRKGDDMADRMKKSIQRMFWRMCWLIAATGFIFFAIAEFARQHQVEKAAASNGIIVDDAGTSVLINQDAAIGLACIGLVCLLIALRKRHHNAKA